MERYGHIFISYSSKEAAVAAKVCDYLEALDRPAQHRCRRELCLADRERDQNL